MQRDNRGTFPDAPNRPERHDRLPDAPNRLAKTIQHLGFAGERPGNGSANRRWGTGRSPANPKLLDGLGKPIWGVMEAIVPLLSFCIPLLSFYYPLIIPYYPLIILLHGVI